MKLALITFGSAGDVHPMLALAQALQQRGHSVVLLSLPFFEADAQAAGVPFMPVGHSADYEQTLAHPKLWHPVDGLGVLWRYLMRPVLQPGYEALTALIGAGLDAIVAPPIVMSARVASERWGTPLLSVYTAATMLRSTHAPMTLAAWRVPRWLPSPVMGGIWRVMDRVGLQPLVLPDVDRLRDRAGLPRLRASVFGDWMHSPQGGLALFPDWFAHAPDWPARTVHAGFMLYEQDAAKGLPAHVAAFLDSGEAPVVFMPGTAQRHAGAFYSAALQTCRQLGLRGLLLGPGAPALQEARLCSAAYAPLSLLRGRVRAVVHHGGVGTCAQALRAGVPQAVLPSGFDQFDNAMRLESLGVGLSWPMARVDARSMTRLVRHLLEAPGCMQACDRWAARVDVAAARQQACQAVEVLPS